MRQQRRCAARWRFCDRVGHGAMLSKLRYLSNMSLTFAPETKATNPPGALCAGQRPDKALNNAQFAAARQARADGTARGLTGRDLEVFVCQAAMRA